MPRRRVLKYVSMVQAEFSVSSFLVSGFVCTRPVNGERIKNPNLLHSRSNRMDGIRDGGQLVKYRNILVWFEMKEHRRCALETTQELQLIHDIMCCTYCSTRTLTAILTHDRLLSVFPLSTIAETRCILWNIVHIEGRFLRLSLLPPTKDSPLCQLKPIACFMFGRVSTKKITTVWTYCILWDSVYMDGHCWQPPTFTIAATVYRQHYPSIIAIAAHNICLGVFSQQSIV